MAKKKSKKDSKKKDKKKKDKKSILAKLKVGKKKDAKGLRLLDARLSQIERIMRFIEDDDRYAVVLKEVVKPSYNLLKRTSAN